MLPGLQVAVDGQQSMERDQVSRLVDFRSLAAPSEAYITFKLCALHKYLLTRPLDRLVATRCAAIELLHAAAHAAGAWLRPCETQLTRHTRVTSSG
jgi:hypothetical protein